MPEDIPPLVAAALAWHDAGACVLPAANDGSKRPGTAWEKYQRERPTREEVGAAAAMSEGIGLVCGAVSGNLEMLEFEGRAIDLFPTFVGILSDQDPELATLLMAHYAERTPSGGIHLLYRISDGLVDGNLKLARRVVDGAVEVLIETRGEGGWVVIAPSAGRTHPSGTGWTILTGPPGNVAMITAEQRNLLHAIARTFDQMPEVAIEHREALPVVTGELTPGQDYEARTTWAEILEPEGWRLCGRHGDKLLWTRPGKDPRYGASATTNYDGNDNLWVFTSSTTFEPEQSYTKFAAYAHLHHGGDFSEAARDLRANGYGSPPRASTAQAESRATLSLIPGGLSSTPSTSGSSALAPREETSSPSPFDLTDVGNARRFVAVESPRLRYSPERDAWLVWLGGRWHWLAGDGAAVRAMVRLIDAMQPTTDAELKHKLRSLSEPAIRRAVRLARAESDMEVTMNKFDADPYALNTPGGVIDLRTTELRPHDPTELHTRMTGVHVDFEMACPRWEKFLADTFGDDPELIGYVQRVFGYAATGKVTHHLLPFLVGSGANGKSVMADIFLRLLGSYASTAPADFLLLGGREDESAIARLAGLRLVICSEVAPTAKFNEQKIKLLTGGDQLTARFLFQNHFTFTPTHTLVLMGNHQPRVDAGGASFWRRLRMIRFTRTVPEAQRIEGLADLLVDEEGPAILAWLIRGARAQFAGLDEPASVRAATADYAEEEDHLGRFIEERVRFGGGDIVRTSTGEMYRAYEQWSAAEGEKPIPANVFGRELKTRGAGTAKSHGRRFYTNVTLVRPEGDPDPGPTQLRYGD